MNPISLFQTFMLIAHYIDEIAKAGPDFIKLASDVMRAINDFRAGKLTPDEFTVIFDDLKKLITGFTIGHAATDTTTVVIKPGGRP